MLSSTRSIEPVAPHHGLAIHTASPDLGLDLSDFADCRRHKVWPDSRQQTSVLLHQHLAEFILPQTWTDLAFIAVAQGPGGFTGTRLGVVTARTLAQQLQLPLFGISTLAAVAWQTQQALAPNSADIAVQLPAHRGQLYGAIYTAASELEFRATFPDAVHTANEWQQTLDRWTRPYHLVQVEGGLGATVTAILELAYLDWQQGLRPEWSSVLPFYGQSPV
jgi:tRNA threonylcarbamoyl adenosine modification protein YeaZ